MGVSRTTVVVLGALSTVVVRTSVTGAARSTVVVRYSVDGACSVVVVEEYVSALAGVTTKATRLKTPNLIIAVFIKFPLAVWHLFLTIRELFREWFY